MGRAAATPLPPLPPRPVMSCAAMPLSCSGVYLLLPPPLVCGAPVPGVWGPAIPPTPPPAVHRETEPGAPGAPVCSDSTNPNIRVRKSVLCRPACVAAALEMVVCSRVYLQAHLGSRLAACPAPGSRACPCRELRLPLHLRNTHWQYARECVMPHTSLATCCCVLNKVCNTRLADRNTSICQKHTPGKGRQRSASPALPEGNAMVAPACA
jgi:hypothetical protein